MARARRVIDKAAMKARSESQKYQSGTNTPASVKESDFNAVALPFVRALVGTLPQFAQDLSVLEDGHFEATLAAPIASQAGAIVCRSFGQRDVWVRFLPPEACYPVESPSEMVAIVNALLDESAVMAVIADEEGWVGTTLVRPGTVPKLEAGQTATILSWSGRGDRAVAAVEMKRRTKASPPTKKKPARTTKPRAKKPTAKSAKKRTAKSR